MRHAILPAFAAAILIGLAAPALAQETAPAAGAPKCAAPAPLPAEFTGFDAPLKQAASLTADVAPSLSLSAAYRLDLSPALGVAYITAPKKPPEDGRYAGFATFTIAKEGTYSIAASDSVWIDVYSGSESLRAASFGRAECSIIHKLVNFALKPGAYKLQLSNAPVSAVTVMIAPKP